jgi:hypothetical protein
MTGLKSGRALVDSPDEDLVRQILDQNRRLVRSSLKIN